MHALLTRARSTGASPIQVSTPVKASSPSSLPSEIFWGVLNPIQTKWAKVISKAGYCWTSSLWPTPARSEDDTYIPGWRVRPRAVRGDNFSPGWDLQSLSKAAERERHTWTQGINMHGKSCGISRILPEKGILTGISILEKSVHSCYFSCVFCMSLQFWNQHNFETFRI